VVPSIIIKFWSWTFAVNGIDLAEASIILMAGSLLGYVFSKVTMLLLNPLNSYRLAMTMLGACLLTRDFVIEYIEDRKKAMGLASAWGLLFGWTYHSQHVLISALIPKGQEIEFKRLFAYCGQVFSWIPASIVAIMLMTNEDPRYHMLSVLTGFYLLAVICTLPMGLAIQ
jgi:MFS-type transporter involved in bile tolerance (Atg22 family)